MAVLDSPATNAAGIEVNAIVTPQKPRAKTTSLAAAANGSVSAPTNVTEIFQAGPRGARIHLVEGVATANQAATQLQLYRSAADGVAKKFIRAEAFPAVALSNTVAITPVDLKYSDLKPLTLEPNEKLWMGSPVAVTGLNANVEGADY